MEFTRKQFEEWGRLGGRMRARRLSKARMRKIAKKAVKAREEKKKKSYYVRTGKPRGRPPGFSKVNLEEAKSLYRSGTTLQELGNRYGVTRERVRQMLTKEGITGVNGGRMIKAFLSVEDKKLEKSRYAKNRALRIFKSWSLSVEQYEEMIKRYGNSGKNGSPFMKYLTQKRQAKLRGIQWKLTFAEWWKVWQDSGKYHLRGRGQGYVMSRYGNSGPYEIGNIIIILGVENNSDRKEKKSGLPMGVSKRGRKFVAKRMLKGKKYHIGTFDTADAAHAAYLGSSMTKDKQ